jgi:membrane-associated phospholipid phosphatase
VTIRREGRLAAVALLGLVLTGCAGVLPDERRWGEDATITPGWDRVWWSAARAALDARTLVPAAATGVFAIGKFDENVSDWAAKKTPIFGSSSTARTYSDVMSYALLAESFLTILPTPSGDLDCCWLAAKAKGFLVEGVATGMSAGAVEGLKAATHRERPDGSDDKSFPSAHSARSFTAAALAASNLQSAPIDPWIRTALDIANTTAALSVAWARVEGHKHFPTDVLAGAAIGNFIGLFVHGAFLGLREEDTAYWRILPLSGGAMLVLGWRY